MQCANIAVDFFDVILIPITKLCFITGVIFNFLICICSSQMPVSFPFVSSDEYCNVLVKAKDVPYGKEAQRILLISLVLDKTNIFAITSYTWIVEMNTTFVNIIVTMVTRRVHTRLWHEAISYSSLLI
jgi:hypothetical protein